VCELVLRLCVYRSNFWSDTIRVLDFVIVLMDVLSEILSIFSNSDGFAPVSILRILRLMRLARAVKIVRMFPELHDLILCVNSATKITMWGCGFIAITILIWSILATQLIYPISLQLQCGTCGNPWKSVWQSSITITQLMLANDSWGQLCTPIIQHSPWTLFFFVAMLLSSHLLILNLILAVIVQHAQVTYARVTEEKDQKERMLHATAHAKLLQSMETLDTDQSGTISRAELLSNVEKHSALSSQIDLLGIELCELSAVFDLVDIRGEGEVTYRDFVTNLYRLRDYDPLNSTIAIMTKLQRLHEAVSASLRGPSGDAGDEAAELKAPLAHKEAFDCNPTCRLFSEEAPPLPWMPMGSGFPDETCADLCEVCMPKVIQLCDMMRGSLDKHVAALTPFLEILAKKHRIPQNGDKTVHAAKQRCPTDAIEYRRKCQTPWAATLLSTRVPL